MKTIMNERNTCVLTCEDVSGAGGASVYVWLCMCSDQMGMTLNSFTAKSDLTQNYSTHSAKSDLSRKKKGQKELEYYIYL